MTSSSLPDEDLLFPSQGFSTNTKEIGTAVLSLMLLWIRAAWRQNGISAHAVRVPLVHFNYCSVPASACLEQ